MRSKDARDLLNDITKELCPELHLEFLTDHTQMTIQTAHIRIQNSISVDNCEIEMNQSNKILTHLIKLRLIDALMNIRHYTLKNLRELRKKGT